MRVRDTLGVTITPRMHGLADTVLNVPYHRQEQSNWCWAGCCEMIYQYYGVNNIRQCDMAST